MRSWEELKGLLRNRLGSTKESTMKRSDELGDMIKEGEMVELSLNSVVGLTPPQTMKVKRKDGGW